MGLYRRPVYVSPRMVVEFEMDRRGMREVARGPELRAAVGIIAKKGQLYAEGIAPERSGHYKKSFQVNFARITIAGMRRVAARLVNTDPAAISIEWGTKRTPAHRTLTRTLAFLGGKTGLPGGRQERGVLHVRDQAGNLRPGLIGRAPAGGLKPIPTLGQFREQQRRRREANKRNRARIARNHRRMGLPDNGGNPLRGSSGDD